MIRNLQLTQERHSSVNSTDPFLLCAADDNYAKPLTVMLHSAVSNLREGVSLNVILMDGGIQEESWAGIKESLANLPIKIMVVKPDAREIEDLVTSHHITHTAYFRLLAAEFLPTWLDKAIYLDSDVLVRGDLTELWEADLGGHYCLAVPDIACPYVDARHGGENRRKANPYMAAISPIPNWKRLGLNGDASYFNSGVMVLNLKRWREDSVADKLLDCLRDNEQHVWCWDQYALNVVFSEQWGHLPARWNQGAHVFEYPGAEHSPIGRDEFVDMRDQPAIIHFTTEWKPWQHRPFHPLADEYFVALDQTAWSGWRPESRGFHLGEAWTDFAVKVVRRATISYRKLAGFWR